MYAISQQNCILILKLALEVLKYFRVRAKFWGRSGYLNKTILICINIGYYEYSYISFIYNVVNLSVILTCVDKGK